MQYPIIGLRVQPYSVTWEFTFAAFQVPPYVTVRRAPGFLQVLVEQTMALRT